MVHKIPLKVHWSLSYNTLVMMWERGMLTRGQIRTWLFGLEQTWEQLPNAWAPHSPNMRGRPPQRPPITLIPRPQTKPDSVSG